MTKDLLKLIILIIIVGAIIVGVYFIGKSIDNQSKYRHPITRPGVSW